MRARDNPFAVDRVHRLAYRWTSGDWSAFLERLAAHHYRGAIVGPEGAGKTTLLEQLAERLGGQGWGIRLLKLTREQPVFDAERLRRTLAGLSASDVVLLDGAEQLTWWRWRRFLAGTRRAGGLIITSHTPGRLATVVQCQTSLPLAQALAAELWGHRDPGLEQLVEILFSQHQGNVRDVLRALYDHCAANELG